MKAWAKEFYYSKAWRRKRNQIFKDRFGLCERCNKPGEIVHHKIYLTYENISDPDIALGDTNLELLCRVCHALEHEGQPVIEQGLMFDENGDIVCIQ